MNIESLPAPLQRAIAARDAAVAPFSPAIDSLDVSWRIVEGNFRELLQTLDMFDTDDAARAVAVWQQAPPMQHRYHNEVVRRLHNLLSAAVAHLAHTARTAVLLKRFNSGANKTYGERRDSLHERLRFLIVIRDFSIHGGAHQSVLTLHGTADGTFVGRVGFSVEPILREQRTKLASARSKREKDAATATIAELEATGDTWRIRPLVSECIEELSEHRKWFRDQLIRLHESLSKDLARWATSPEDRASVVQYFIDNPIPVHVTKQTGVPGQGNE